MIAAPGGQEIEARFVYLGPTAETAPLRSGAIRRQFGLKLRAADGCNLIYAMWRFAPEPALVVSVKSNFGLHTSRACGAAGYRNVTPRRQRPVEAPEIGVPHRLAAALDGEALRVRIDGWKSGRAKSAMRRSPSRAGRDPLRQRATRARAVRRPDDDARRLPEGWRRWAGGIGRRPEPALRLASPRQCA